MADTPVGYAVIQRDVNRLEKWADRNLMKFYKGKWKVLHLGRNNSVHQYMLGPAGRKAALARRTLGSWWTIS